MKVTGEEMIKKKIEYYCRVFPLSRIQAMAAYGGNGVRIGEMVDLPVKLDPRSYFHGVIIFAAALDVIGYEIAQHDFRVIAGKKEMREMIQRSGLRMMAGRHDSTTFANLMYCFSPLITTIRL